MAGVSTKEIKNRIRSMESTKQITKAMEMVASSKLRRAQVQIQNSRPYFQILRQTIDEIIASNRDFSSPYLTPRDVKKSLYIVIAGDRGLAGGYNSNIFKLVQSRIQGNDALVLPIGKKAVDYFRAHRVPMVTELYSDASGVSIGECFSIAKQIASGFKKGEYDEVYIAFTRFESVLSQIPHAMQLLPLTKNENTPASAGEILYEPGSIEVFDAVVPEYLGGILYGSLCESRASEHAARRTAMDSATGNAEEMIADLSLKYNRARQAAITQEITEIVAGP